MEAKKKITKTILYILLISLALFMLVPFYWMVISSLKLNKDCILHSYDLVAGDNASGKLQNHLGKASADYVL